MMFGLDIYPAADYLFATTGLDAAFDERRRFLGVTSLRYNLAGEYYAIKQSDRPAGDEELVYSAGFPAFMQYVSQNSLHCVVGIDVLKPPESNRALLEPWASSIAVLELHNEPALEPWRQGMTGSDYYENCWNQIHKLRTLGIPYCLQFHSLAKEDAKFYGDFGVHGDSVRWYCRYFSPHSYGLHHLRGYEKYGKRLLVTEYNPFRPGHFQKRSDLWRALLTWLQLLLFKAHSQIEAIYAFHAGDSFFHERPAPGSLEVRLNRRTVNVHRRFAGKS